MQGSEKDTAWGKGRVIRVLRAHGKDLLRSGGVGGIRKFIGGCGGIYRVTMKWQHTLCCTLDRNIYVNSLNSFFINLRNYILLANIFHVCASVRMPQPV